jgi:NAD(P)-dependent dehydrogenase (short-subunit alcohol dehydrogenase family)
MRELMGKVAVVTGAASGIGLALASRFGAEGMRVVLADVETAALEEAVARLRADGVAALGVRTDVASAESVVALAARAVEAFGTVHLLCNNAGVGGTGTLAWEGPVAMWDWMIGVNLLGVVHGLRAFVPLLMEQGEGHIVNTASMSGFAAGLSASTAYTATKYGVIGLSESLALELELIGSPVRVSVLIPGPVETNIADAIRNWPTELGTPPGRARDDRAGNLPIPPVLMRSLQSKMDPDEVALLVRDGVLDGRFWIATHPAEFAAVIEERTRSILLAVEPEREATGRHVS